MANDRCLAAGHDAPGASSCELRTVAQPRDEGSSMSPPGRPRDERFFARREGRRVRLARRPRVRASELLAQIAADPQVDSVSLGELLDPLGRRGFGILLFIGTLPALIPSPVGAGALAAPLVILCGLQLALGLPRPWLPAWLRRRRFSRTAAQAFVDRAGRWLHKLERLARPRWMPVLGPIGIRAVGLLAMGHGVALALPLPLTNYPFAAVALLLAVALLEDDGLLGAAAALGMIAAMVMVATGAGAAVEALW